MEWKNIPESMFREWREPFEASRDGLKVCGKCAVCGAEELYRYFSSSRRPPSLAHPHKTIVRGGLWEWCRACRSYGHYSASIPDWWQCPLVLDTKSLTPVPDIIDEAILGFEGVGSLH